MSALIKDDNLKEKVQVITDVFTGVGGGLPFIKFCMFVNKMSDEGSESSKEILKYIEDFSTLLAYVSDIKSYEE